MDIGPLHVGLAQISIVPEFERYVAATILGDALTPALVAAHAAWLTPHFYDADKRAALLSIHSWLIRIDGRTILIDPCAGNHKPRRPGSAFNQLATPWLDRLAAAGAAPEDIDIVLCTHLHNDHCGWNTRLVDGRWVPTFPRARYHFSRGERDFWRDRPFDPAVAGGAITFGDSVLPVIEAGQDVILDGGETIDGCLRIEAAPGHTPGHVMARLTTAGAHDVMFVGDVLHHPLQIYRPDINSAQCLAPDTARRTRRAVLERCADENLLLAPAHFRAPHLVRIARDGADAFGVLW